MPMAEIDDKQEDEEVAREIVQALTEAQRRWMQSGRTVVLVRNDQLIRILPDGEIEVIRQLPPRPRVSNRRRMLGS